MNTDVFGNNIKGLGYYTLKELSKNAPQPQPVAVPTDVPDRYSDRIRMPVWVPHAVGFGTVAGTLVIHSAKQLGLRATAAAGASLVKGLAARALLSVDSSCVTCAHRARIS